MKILSLLICMIVFFSCKKSDKKETTPIVPTILSIDSTQGLPGEAIVIKTNKKNTTSTVNILLNGSLQKGYSMGDSSYVSILPVIAPGIVSISIPDLPVSNSLSLTIKQYTPISNPQSVINEYVDKRNKSIDSVTKVVVGSNFQPSSESIIMLNQIKEEWDLQINRISQTDKELLAYVLRKYMMNPVLYSFTGSPVGYYARESGVLNDVGDKLVAEAKVFVTAQGFCLGTIPFVVASGYVFIAAPNPISAVIFLGVWTTFIVSREIAIRKAQEVGRLKGVAEAVTGTALQRTAAVEFRNNTEKTLSMSVKFRNLTTADATIQNDIQSAFIGEHELSQRDQEIDGIYKKIIGKTDKLKEAFKSYIGSIGKQVQGNIVLPADGNNIEIKGVSDSRINVSSSLSGTNRKVKITSSATTEVNFILTTSYRRSLDGTRFSQDIGCIFKPDVDSTEIYRSAVPGNWTMTWNLGVQSQSNDQVDKFTFYGGGTGIYYWMKPTGSNVGITIGPENAVYKVMWNVRKADSYYFLDISYPDRGWSSSSQMFLNPSPRCGVPIANAFYFLGVKD